MSNTIAKLDIDIDELKTKIDFNCSLYDLHSKDGQFIKEKTSEIATTLNRKEFKGPLTALVQELVTNGLKAIYKQIYFQYIIPELRIENVSYETKLELFRNEIDANKTKNFLRIVKEKNLYVTVQCNSIEEGIEFIVENPGELSEIENYRVQSNIQNARKLSDLSSLLREESENKSKKRVHHEGAGLGLFLIIMTLRNMGAQLSNFTVNSENNKTRARILLPWRAFFSDPGKYVRILEHENVYEETIMQLMENLNYYIIVFESNENILSTSKSFVANYNLPESKEELKFFFPKKFFEDIFHGEDSIFVNGRFDNYRLWLTIKHNSKKEQEKNSVSTKEETKDSDILFNISGFLNKDSTITTLWIPVFIKNKSNTKLAEGSITEAIEMQKILRPYLPEKIIAKAREVIKKGGSRLPEESKPLTMLFADIVGFTNKVEKLEPQQAVDLLNIALGILVRSIESNTGYIDKFMGDAVMAIFEIPLNATIAAIEIQHLFSELNEFRKLSNQDIIQVRIGIHTGDVIMGNIGTENRRDWTVIGDVVNTASRLERNAFEGTVLISEDTYNEIRKNVTSPQKGILRAKGKKKEVRVYFIDSIVFQKNGKKITISLKR